MAINAAQTGKTVADPNAAYLSVVPLWKKSRAVCGGERFVKEFDAYLDVNTFTNMLIPFSSSMTQEQYEFYKAEAELPGITAQFAKFLVGGLLRKQPHLELPDTCPADAKQWILDEFTQDSSPLSAFLDTALWEEVQTSRAWVYVDYPRISNVDELTTEDFKALKPYPVLWNAESVINWRLTTNSIYGTQVLDRVITRSYAERYDNDVYEFHPKLVDTVCVHELVDGYYRIRTFERQSSANESIAVVDGKTQQQYSTSSVAKFDLVDVNENILFNGERLKCIPAWPLNGSFVVNEPMLLSIIDKELSLYNKLSRRNHLLYGAATYTPYICSDMDDEHFDDIVNAGLGSWFKLRPGDTAGVLDTPTEALQDMDRAIEQTISEMAKLGIRMLTPETEQSGIALEIRNASQTAQLGTLNTKVSNQMASIIAFMLNWRYGTEFKSSDIKFTLSADFNPAPLGDQWLRLITEWYEKQFIPRSTWIEILKQNDIIPPDYDDEVGQEEINNDPLIANQNQDFLDKLKSMNKGKVIDMKGNGNGNGTDG